MRRYIRKLLLVSKLKTLVILLLSISLIALSTWYVPSESTRSSADKRHLSNDLIVFVLSKRDSFARREEIRNTWASKHDNVFFVVGERYCSYLMTGEENELCNLNTSFSKEDIRSYIDKEIEINAKLVKESNVILVPTGDELVDIPNKVAESYKWALKSTKADWYLHVLDKVDIEIDVDKVETNIKELVNASSDSYIVISTNDKLPSHRLNEDNVIKKISMCHFCHLVSKCVAQFAKNDITAVFDYRQRRMKIAEKLKIKTMKISNSTLIRSKNCSNALTVHLSLSINKDCFTSDDKAVRRPSVYTLFENPSLYIHSDRFDLIIKMIYAKFYLSNKEIPKIITHSYKEHLRVWNKFKEYCKHRQSSWFDGNRPCQDKQSFKDFVQSFHNIIDGLKSFGFNESLSRIPVDKKGLILNGAHRLAASVVLSKYVTVEHHKNTKQNFHWGYEFFRKAGLEERVFDTVILEWMKLQIQLPYLTKTVSVISIFSNDKKTTGMRDIVEGKCSQDGQILYKKTVAFTRKGARQLLTHMYGGQSWLEVKIKQTLSKFGSRDQYEVLFLFVYAKDNEQLVQCKQELRQLYNDKNFKSTVHIPDTSEENLILATMILNNNSIQFMNYAEDPVECHRIAKEIATRSSKLPIKTLPGIYPGEDGIMVDSGAAMSYFGLRKRTDVDILFLQKIDKSMLGDHSGMNIQEHAFAFNSISNERAWGEDHFSENGPRDQLDLFFDQNNFGYCYGIKFVSLKQLIRYKQKRNEPGKDNRDVKLIRDFLKSIKP